MGSDMERSKITSRTHVLVMSDDISEEGGIRSRVLGELSLVARHAELDIVAKTRVANLRRMKKARNEIASVLPSAHLWFVPYLPHRGFIFAKEFVSLLNVVIMVTAGFVIGLRTRPSTIYAHNMECSIVAVILGRLLGTRVTGDFHGDEVEENLVAFSWRRAGLRFRLWKRLMGVVVRACPLVVCVSEKHRIHFEESYGRNKPVIIVPCCANPNGVSGNHPGKNREASTTKPCGERFVLLYSGSSSAHQLVPKMIEFNESLNKSGTESCLLLLISDKSQWVREELLSGPAAESVKVDSVSHEKVRTYAEEADVGLLFREDQVFNNISSPTKFSEYLMAGLPVLLSPHIGDFSEIVLSHKLGRIVDLQRMGDSEYVGSIVREVRDDQGIRDRCRDYGVHNLSWDAVEPNVLRAFGIESE